MTGAASPAEPDAVTALLGQIGYSFSDRALLHRALTHRSARPDHNERLEFLGDAILNFIVAEALYERMEKAAEGVLTRARAGLVRQRTLADAARQIGLGPCLELGDGERKNAGYERDSILADAFEAVIGAIYLDGGLMETRRIVLQVFARRLELSCQSTGAKDPKTCLQEMLQAQQLPLPEYLLLRTEGAPHEQRFIVECRVRGLEFIKTLGEGSTRRKAEQGAAQKALELMGSPL